MTKRKSASFYSKAQQHQPPPSDVGASLIAKRDSILARVKAIHENFESKLTSDNFEQYRPMLDKLTELQQRFESIQEQVIDLNSELEKSQRYDIDGPQVSLDTLVFEAQALFLQYEPKKTRKSAGDDTASPLLSSTVASASTSAASAGRFKALRYPRMELPHFNGNIANWRTFYNVFRVNVHEAPELNAIEKFQILQSRVEGEAFELIKALDYTEDNYYIAYDLLVKRYNSERRFILFHFNNLSDLPDVKHSSQVPSFLSKLRENTQALTALGHPISSYDPFLTTVVYRKLSPHFRRRFEDYRGTTTNFPKLDNVIKYLEKECILADDPNLQSRDRKETKTFIASTSSSPPKAPQNGKGQPEANSSSSCPTQHSGRSCPLCYQSHNLMACPDFKSKTALQRRELAAALKVCFNCLKKDGHFVPTCPLDSSCQICQKRHHSLLHPEEESSTSQSP